MEPRPANIPGHPEVIGQLDVDPEAGWPPVVALFIDVGNTPTELVPQFVEATVASLRGLFPAGRVLFVPLRDGRGTHLYRLEPEPPDDLARVMLDSDRLTAENAELRQRVAQLELLERELREELDGKESEMDDLRDDLRYWRGSSC